MVMVVMVPLRKNENASLGARLTSYRQIALASPKMNLDIVGNKQGRQQARSSLSLPKNLDRSQLLSQPKEMKNGKKLKTATVQVHQNIIYIHSNVWGEQLFSCSQAQRNIMMI